MMTRIKIYKMVQKQNIDIPLFSENQAWQSYIAFPDDLGGAALP